MSVSNQKGDVGEAAFMLASAKKNYWVGQMPQNCPYDFVLDKKDGKLLRVQVKYRAIGKNGTVQIKISQNTFTNRTTYSGSNIDYIAVYVVDLDKVYLIPIADAAGKTDLYLRCIAAKNNQKDNVCMIDSYEQW